jgi:hypothetical protein
MTNDHQINEDKATTEEETYAEELGTIVFQSALMQFLVSEEDSQTEAFNAFIEAHVETDSFLEDLCNEYPEFEKMLREEMLLLQKELTEIVPD